MNIDEKVKQPRKRGKVPTAVRKAIENFDAAYKAVYGCHISNFEYDKETKFIRIGNASGVTYQRLNQMTRQLKFRAGIV